MNKMDFSRLAGWAACAGLLLMPVMGTFAARGQEAVTVRFEVRLSEAAAKINATGPLEVRGNLPELGAWGGKGLSLVRGADGVFTGEIAGVKAGTTIECKVTRGGWETVEKAGDGGEINNREIVVKAGTEAMVVAMEVQNWADGVEAKKVASTATGDIREHAAVRSEVLGNTRRVWVWLPEGYEQEPERRYPVLYMHDGQNCFDAALSFSGEWRADETARDLIAAGKIEPIIIVAVENTGLGRFYEYTPTEFVHKAIGEARGGGAEKYARFLIEELKPMIDRTYRTKAGREDTGVAGSSLGGLVSLYLGQEHGATYGKVGAVSPSLFWGNRQLMLAVMERPEKVLAGKLWMDMGTEEERMLDNAVNSLTNARELAAVLSAADAKAGGGRFEYFEAAGAKHHESDWAARFGKILEFLYGK
jgi:predicted alpha/beta superfamily hydrolase